MGLERGRPGPEEGAARASVDRFTNHLGWGEDENPMYSPHQIMGVRSLWPLPVCRKALQ